MSIKTDIKSILSYKIKLNLKHCSNYITVDRNLGEKHFIL